MANTKRFLLVLALALILPAAPARADFITNSCNLPPLGGQYVSPAMAHQLYMMGGLTVEVINIRHFGFNDSFQPPPNVGGMTMESFGSTLEGDVIMNGGTAAHFAVPALVTVKLTKVSGTDGMAIGSTYATQMTQLDATLMPGVMISIDPTMASTGQTTINDGLPQGFYRITSFFDVFTDLSLNGGAPIPAMGSGHVELQPVAEPVTLTLAVVGVVGFAVGAWRSRRSRNRCLTSRCS